MEPRTSPPPKPTNAYLVEHDAIARTMLCYIAAARAGDGDLMRPAFHPCATISGYCQGVEYTGSVEHVFKWITENGPAPNISPRFARIEIIESIAVVHLEVERWSGSWRAPMPELPTYSLCSSGTANGRSPISCFTGTTKCLLTVAASSRLKERIGSLSGDPD